MKGRMAECLHANIDGYYTDGGQNVNMMNIENVDVECLHTNIDRYKRIKHID